MSDLIENRRATTQQIIEFARRQGMDVVSLRPDHLIIEKYRYIVFWHYEVQTEGEKSPLEKAKEEAGPIHYTMQGPIYVIPAKFRTADDAGGFRGSWFEGGGVQNIEQATAVLKAWLVDYVQDVDELPATRRVIKCQVLRPLPNTA